MNASITTLSIGFLTLASSIAFARPPHAAHFDIDQDGQITRAEVESRAASKAQEVDADGDGLISLEELQADHARRQLERMQARLDEADSNGDGVVGQDEFSAQIVEHVFARDSNNDDVLNAADRGERGARRPRPGQR